VYKIVVINIIGEAPQNDNFLLSLLFIFYLHFSTPPDQFVGKYTDQAAQHDVTQDDFPHYSFTSLMNKGILIPFLGRKSKRGNRETTILILRIARLRLRLRLRKNIKTSSIFL
jgi:hypothetical protein